MTRGDRPLGYFTAIASQRKVKTFSSSPKWKNGGFGLIVRVFNLISMKSSVVKPVWRRKGEENDVQILSRFDFLILVELFRLGMTILPAGMEPYGDLSRLGWGWG